MRVFNPNLGVYVVWKTRPYIPPCPSPVVCNSWWDTSWTQCTRISSLILMILIYKR